MLLKKIKNAVLKSKIVSIFYRAVFYFETGKNQIGRAYAWLPEMVILLGGLKYLFKIDLTRTQMVFIILGFALMFTITGYLIKHTGLWDIDQEIKAQKNPVTATMYAAAKKILEEKNGKN